MPIPVTSFPLLTMLPEHEQQPIRFDLEIVTRMVTEVALETGGHTPTLFFESNAGLGMVHIPDFADTHAGRAQQMFSIGFTLARGGQFHTLKQVFLVSEAWLSLYPKGDPPKPVPSPSQDPNRREVLIIAGLNLATQQADLALLEMIRSAGGDLTELRHMESSVSSVAEVNSPLLTAFVLGFDAGRSRS